MIAQCHWDVRKLLLQLYSQIGTISSQNIKGFCTFSSSKFLLMYWCIGVPSVDVVVVVVVLLFFVRF